jgi:TolA-binding protein
MCEHINSRTKKKCTRKPDQVYCGYHKASNFGPNHISNPKSKTQNTESKHEIMSQIDRTINGKIDNLRKQIRELEGVIERLRRTIRYIKYKNALNPQLLVQKKFLL